MSIDPSTGLFSRDLPLLDCEHTEPGAETEAIDCWATATKRHVNADGATVGVFCDEHDHPADGVTVETI